jgi:F-type H+-transporting ATPase subunit b
MSPTSFIAVLAEAGASAPQSAEQQLLDIDGTLFVQLGLFLVVSLALTKWLWRPYLKVKAERVRRVEGYREEAKAMELEAQTRLQKIEAELAETRRLGSAERTRARLEAQAQEQRLVTLAQASAAKALADAKARVESSLAAERGSLMARAALLGREAAERVLGRKVAS